MAKKKLHLERLDKHSFWLKVAALTAKSLCLIPILNFILLIYALVLGDKQDAAEQAMAQQQKASCLIFCDRAHWLLLNYARIACASSSNAADMPVIIA